MTRWLALIPAGVVALGAAIAWGQLLQQNDDQDRRIHKVEDAVITMGEISARQERIDERTLHIQKNLQEQRRLLDGLVRVWGKVPP
tara:strand:- start:791 stop:1048 length:258 start_codon:yes stop_codon:yes gene_type:complete